MHYEPGDELPVEDTTGSGGGAKAETRAERQAETRGEDATRAAERQPDEPLQFFQCVNGMLFQPSATMDRILRVQPTFHVYTLATLLGFVTNVDRLDRHFIENDEVNMVGLLALSVVLAPVTGIFRLYVSGVMLSFCGALFGGVGDGERCRAVWTWGRLPQLPMVFVAVFLLLALPSGDEWNPTVLEMVGFGAAAVISLVCLPWSMVTFVTAYSRAHRFSIGRAVASLALPFVLCLGLIFGFFALNPSIR